MANNVPIDVATIGLISGQATTIATDGFIDATVVFEDDVSIPSNNVGASIGDPRQEFYVRRDENDALFGPLTFQHADAQCRELSDPTSPLSVRVNPLDVAASGFTTDVDALNVATDGFITPEPFVNVAQMVTFLGVADRGGDPDKSPSHLFIVYLYVLGKRTFGGRAATFQSNRTGSVDHEAVSPVSGFSSASPLVPNQLTLSGTPLVLGGTPIVFTS